MGLRESRMHISLVQAGDTIRHNGQLRTVTRRDIHKGFMGTTVFGDSYRCGMLPVTRVLFVPEGGRHGL